MDLIVSIEVARPDIKNVSDDIAGTDEVRGDEVSQPSSAKLVDLDVEGASIHSHSSRGPGVCPATLLSLVITTPPS